MIFAEEPKNPQHSYHRDDASGEAGLDYAMARYYASHSGRIMTL